MSQLKARVEDMDLDALESMAAEDLLRYAHETFGDRAAIGTSGQKSGVIIIDLAARLQLPLRVFFVDTEMNPPETYELLTQVESTYSLQVERFTPNPDDVKWLHETFGQWPHFLARETCCRVRKGRPHDQALATLDCWIAGLRADQSGHRAENARKASLVTGARGAKILKLNPLLDWTDDQVDAYTAEHRLPYNKLYDYVSPLGEKYNVIGCSACHIPVKDEFDKRSGKFPWEHGKKECGLHKDGGGI